MADTTINVTNYPALESGARVERKYAMHCLDVSFSTTPEWYRIGDDFEDFSVELNPDTEVVKNILGTSSFRHNGYEPSADGDPFYARVGDKLFTQLQTIADTQATGDACKTKMMEVHLWQTAQTGTTGSEVTVYAATTQDCYVVPTSTGGDTAGYQIPFTISLVGEKTTGAFTPPASSSGTGTFTAGTWTQDSGGTWTFTPAST